MSGLARVFVVFVLLLSVLFFGASATLFKTRTNWRIKFNEARETTQDLLYGQGGNADTPRDMADGSPSLAKRLLEQQGVIDRQNDQINELQNTQNDLALRAEAAEKRITQVQADLASEKEARSQADTRTTALANEKAKEIERNTKLQSDLDTAKAKTDNALSQLAEAIAARDSVVLDLAKSQRELHEARVEYNRLQEEHQEIVALYTALKQRLPPGVPIPGPIQPKIDALVSAVDHNEQLVVLSAGKDQNVEPGYKFTVARGSDFIGKVEVIRVYPDLAGARILFTDDGQTIERGDKAFTAED